jgi:peptidoglycan hydrolase CwlO-like protein
MAGQTVIVGLLVYLGQKVVARSSKEANDKTAEVQKDANAVSGFHELVGDLQADIGRLRGEVSELRGELDKTNEHVKTLEDQRVKDKSLIRYLVTYVRTLIGALTQAGIPIPEAPAGLDIDGGPLGGPLV